MAINNFKSFALDPNANVTSQADWEALPALLSGFTAGKASSAQVNKAIRQASFIAAALAQYTANKSGLDVLDDGDLNGFISKMGTAFGKDFQALDATLSALAGLATGANKLPYFTGNDTAAQTDLTSVGRDIIGKNTIADILTYLGLVNNGAVGRLIGRPMIITSSGTYTPTSGAKFAWVQIVGGGGGGGGATSSQNFNAAGGGGGAGGYAAKWVDLSSISSVVVTIGAGGNGASASGTNGSSGGITSFGSIFSASGGSLGNSAVGTGNNMSTIVGAGSQGGTGTGGDLNCSGGSGLGGVSASPTIAGASVGPGIGGSSILSGPGGYGAGGNGGATVANSVPGSSGRSGIAIIWEYA